MCIYIYIYIYIHVTPPLRKVGQSSERLVRGPRTRACRNRGYSAEGGAVGGGCSGWGWYYIAKLVHNIIYITTPCFHCTPLCGM